MSRISEKYKTQKKVCGRWPDKGRLKIAIFLDVDETIAGQYENRTRELIPTALSAIKTPAEHAPVFLWFVVEGNARNPRVVGSVQPKALDPDDGFYYADMINSLAVSDEYVYGVGELIFDTGAMIDVINVSEPSNPYLETRAGNWEPFIRDSIVRSGHHLFVAFWGGPGVYDITDPSKPEFLGHWEEGDGKYVSELVVSDPYVWVYDESSWVVRVLDASNPSALVSIGSFDVKCPGGPMTISKNHLYLTCNNAEHYKWGHLNIVDVSDPTDPQLISNDFDLPGEYNRINDITIQAPYVYLATYSGLYIIDVSSASSPKLLGCLGSDEFNGRSPLAISVFGKYVYALTSSDFFVTDVSDTSTPEVVASISELLYHNGNWGSPRYSREIALSLPLAFVSSGFYGVQVIDLGTFVDYSAPDLAVTIEDSPDPVKISGGLEYRVTVRNQGEEDAQGVVLTQSIDSDLNLLVYVPSQGSCTESQGTLTWDVGALASGADAELLIGLLTTQAGIITTTATVTSEDEDYHTDNDTASEQTRVVEPQLVLDKEASSDILSIGDTLSYTIRLTNLGELDISDAELKDTLPAQVDFVSATCNVSGCACVESQGIVTCDVGDLSVGEQATVIVETIVTQAGTATNTVVAEGEDFDTLTATDTTTVCGVELAISSSELDPSVRVGSYVLYAFTIANQGCRPAVDVLFTGELAGSYEFISAAATSGTCVPAGDIITCVIGQMQPGELDKVTILVRASEEGGLSCTGYVDANNQWDCISQNDSVIASTRARIWLNELVDYGCSPSLSLDSKGQPHIAYARGSEIGYAVRDRDRWSRQTIAGKGWPYGPSSSPAIDVNGSDKVTLCYDQYEEDPFEAWIECRSRTSSEWQPAEIVAESDEGFAPLSMAVDPAGNVHVCYNDAWVESMSGMLEYVTNADGSWCDPVELGQAYDDVEIVADSDNCVHLVYYLPQGGAMYRTNGPSGTWQNSEPISSVYSCGQCEGMVTDIAVDSNNTPHVSFVMGSPEQYYYAHRDGLPWSLYLVGPSTSFSSSGNSITLDPSNRPHMTYYSIEEEELRYVDVMEGSASYEVVGEGAYKWWKWNSDIEVDPQGYVHIAYSDGDFVRHATKLIAADDDYDGVPDAWERGPLGIDPDYDGNGDGIPDSEQGNVASLATYNEEGYVTVGCPDSVPMGDVRTTANPSPDDAPAGVDFVYDFLQFKAYVMNPGGSLTVNVYFPEGTQIASYYKYGPTLEEAGDHWYEFLYDPATQTGAVINENVVTLHFVDGLRGDNDLEANGVIEEPGGPVVIDSCKADLNGDGDIDGNDLSAFTAAYGFSSGEEGYDPAADFDDSGAIDKDDLTVVAKGFGKTNCPRP